jgi:hypothetical protein
LRNLNERPEDQDVSTNREHDEVVKRPESMPMPAQPAGQVLSFERRQSENEARETILSAEETKEMGSRWTNIQSEFVDEPRRAVEAADKLVASAIERISKSFSDERSHLETQWSRGDEVSTEDLRIALQRYRTFFGRLLSI